MSYQVSFLSDHKVVEIIYSDMVTQRDLENALTNAIEAGKENGTSKFLADCTELGPDGHSIVDLYDVVGEFERRKIGRDIREAIVFKTGSPILSNVSFFETAARNRGYNVSIFSDREKALFWLNQ